MGVDPRKRRQDKLLGLLWDVHDRAQDAVAARDYVMEAIADALIAGANYRMLSKVSGLSERAIKAYLDVHHRRALNRGPRPVGETPSRPRPRDDTLDSA